ncbi:MAG: hypothetical protein Q9210_004015, partial [Variospora velana]
MALITPAAFAATTFDYLIAGGGTAGLTLAARLSENPAVTVGVIEAGVDRNHDPKVLTPGLATSMWGDGEYETVGQTTNERVVAHPRGKVLGGSSAINLNLWTHASQRDIDDWGLLGNEGWSWADLFPYYNRSENYTSPPPDIAEAEAVNFIDQACHGEGGPVQNKFPPFYSDFYNAWSPTFANLNLSLCGEYVLRSRQESIEPEGSLTNALVTKIDFHRLKDSAGKLRAKGLSFKASDNQTRSARANPRSHPLRRGFPISATARALRHWLPCHHPQPTQHPHPSRQPLRRRKPARSPPCAPLLRRPARHPHLRNTTLFAETLALYTVNRTGPFATQTPTAHLSYAQLLAALPPDQRLPLPPRPPTPHSVIPGSQGAAQQRELTLSKLYSATEAAGQIITLPGGSDPSAPSNASGFLSSPLQEGNYFTLLGVLERPFSRGSVHIKSPDPEEKPLIDPKYLSHPLDVLIMSTVVLFLQQLARTEPLSALLEGGVQQQPGFPSSLNRTNVRDFVRGAYGSEYHPLGTCAMVPFSFANNNNNNNNNNNIQSRGTFSNSPTSNNNNNNAAANDSANSGGGGVVDSKFKVHGTANVRVVDASVAPLMVKGNLQILVYALAERGAGFIIR